jgi:hypothetical protein
MTIAAWAANLATGLVCRVASIAVALLGGIALEKSLPDTFRWTHSVGLKRQLAVISQNPAAANSEPIVTTARVLESG